MVRYVTAAVIVRTADEGARVALVLLALGRTGSAGIGGLLVAALLVPHVVAAPAVGLLTDRGRPRVVLAAAALGFAVSLAATAVLLGRSPLALVVAILVAGGCCGPALLGALTSRIGTLVPAERLPRAFGADSLTYNVAGIAGPSIAGGLVALAGAPAATLVLAGGAVLGAGLIATLPLRAPDPVPGETQEHRRPLTAGIAVIGRVRTLRVVTLASSLGQLGPGALPVVIAVLAARRHQPAATGWLLAAVAAGGLVGSLLWTWRPVTAPRTPAAVMVGLVAVGGPLALAAVTSSLPLVAALLVVSGAALGPFTGALFTVRQRYAPEHVRAQVFTIGAGLKTTAAAAGAALGGALAGLPTSAQFVLVGIVPVLAGAVGGLGLRKRSPGRHDTASAASSDRSRPHRPVRHGPPARGPGSAGSAAATATHSAPTTKK